MLFNSPEFIFLFLPVVLGVLLAVQNRHPGLVLPWLVVASLGFYAWWNPSHTPVLLGSILFNFLASRAIHSTRSRRASRWIVGIAVAANLTALLYYKYLDFLVGDVLGLVHVRTTEEGTLNLPLGISFFTFTQIAYLVDLHCKRAMVSRPAPYLLFVTYFPHLIAGPVLHHQQFMPQVTGTGSQRLMVDSNGIAIGLSLFALGLAKKTLLADPLSAFATPVFDNAGQGVSPMLVEAWSGALCYSFQLYFDFSGYSDMALGLSRMMNVELPANFNSPYKATSLIEFWRRWHISLSDFLKNYVYIPLGGNRHGISRQLAAVLVTMILGGAWHGAGMTFLVWGAAHGALLALSYALGPWRKHSVDASSSRPLTARVPHALRVAGVFLVVTAAWVPFRAPDMETAGRILQGMVGGNGLSLPPGVATLPALANLPFNLSGDGVFAGNPALTTLGPLRLVALLALSGLVVWALPNTAQFFRGHRAGALAHAPPECAATWKPSLTTAAALGTLLALALLAMQGTSEFLYFQF